MSFRTLSYKPLRSLVLSVAGGSLLTVGCMQNPRSMVARDLSAEGKKKAPAVAGNRSTHPFAQTGKVPAPRTAAPRVGNVFASFLGTKPGEVDPSVDPFLQSESAIAQAGGTAPASPPPAREQQVAGTNMNPFGFLKRKPAEGETASASSDNPFEELRRRRETAPAQPAPSETAVATTQPAKFVDGFDSQLDRLRAALSSDVRQTSLNGPAEPPRDEDRRRVETLVFTSRQKLESGDLAEAYRIAQEADALARTAGVILGPDSEHPADLLAILREKLSEPIDVAKEDWTPGGADVAETDSDSADPTDQDLPVAEPVLAANEDMIGTQEPYDPFNRPVPDFGDMIVDSESVPPRIASSAMKPVAAAVWSERESAFAQSPGLDPGHWTNRAPRAPAQDVGVVRASANQGVIVASATSEISGAADAASGPDFWSGAGRPVMQVDSEPAPLESEAAPPVISAENVEWSETPVPAVQSERSAFSGLGLFALTVSAIGGAAVWLWRRRAYRLARGGR